MNGKLKYWDDFLNPVLVKEIRQFFHNKLFLSIVAGLLGVQLVVLLIFSLSFSEWKDGSEAGKIFIVIETILMYVCVLSTSIWGAMQRFTQERSSKELDFTNITLLTPWQIIAGKLASSLVIWALIAALCLPFMTVAYFFRNVSFQDILLIFGSGVVPALILIQGALLCGAFGKKWIYGIFVYFGFQVIVPMAILSIAPFLENVGRNTTAWHIFWMVQGGGVTLFVLLLASTIALITPPYANRMLPLRAILGAMMIPVLAVLPFSAGFKQEIQIVFMLFPLGIIFFFALLAACDRDIPGGRVLAKVPENQVGRFLHYLFSSNRTGGMLLSLLMLLILGAELLIAGCFNKEYYTILAFGISGYILFYTGIGIILSRSVPSIPGWAWTLIVAVLLGILPLIAAANNDISLSEILISPIALLDRGTNEIHVWNYIFWIGPAGAWFLGVHFLIDMLRNYKSYKAPELLQKKDELS